MPDDKQKIDQLMQEIDRLCKVESELRETRAILTSIIDNTDDAIIGKTLDGIITRWNNGAEKIYGYKAEEVIGHHISMLVPPGYPDEIPQILEKIRRGESVEHYEAVRVRKDGNQIYVSLSISPIKNAEGSIIGASTIARDVTERKKIELALIDSEEKYRRIVEIAEEGVVVLNKEDRVIFANPKLVEILGYSKEEILGKTIFQFADDEDRGCINWVLQKNRRGEIIQFDFKFLRKNGSYVWTIVPTSPILDEKGGYTGTLWLVSDISIHKKLEGELILSEARYRAIVEDPTELICRSHPDLTIIFVNKGLSQYMDKSWEQLIDNNFLDIFPESERYLLKKSIGTLNRKNPIIHTENSIILPKKETRWQQWAHIAIFDRSGRYIELQSVGRDITEYKYTEKKLQEAKSQAELLVDLIGRDINNTNQSALGFLELAIEKLDTMGKLDASEKLLLTNSVEALNNSAHLIDNVKKLITSNL